MAEGPSPPPFSLGLSCSVLPSILRVLVIQGKNWSPTPHLPCSPFYPVGVPFSQRPMLVIGSPAWVSRKNSTSQSRSAPRVGQPWERAAQRLRQFRNRGMPWPLLLGFHLEKPGSWYGEGLILGLLSSRTVLSATFGPWHPAPGLFLSLLLSVASPRGSLVRAT